MKKTTACLPIILLLVLSLISVFSVMPTVNAVDIQIISQSTQTSTAYLYLEAVHPSTTVQKSAAGQGFNALVPFLAESITFTIGKGGSPSGFVQAQMFAVSGAFENAIPTGSSLANSTAVDIANLPTGATAFNFTFPNKEFFAADKWFVCLVAINGSLSSGNGVKMFAKGTNVVVGNPATYYSSGWHSTGTSDLTYTMYGDLQIQWDYASFYFNHDSSDNCTFYVNSTLIANESSIEYAGNTTFLDLFALTSGNNSFQFSHFLFNDTLNMTNPVMSYPFIGNVTIWCYFVPVTGGAEITYSIARFEFSPSNPENSTMILFNGSQSYTTEPITDFSWNFGDGNTTSSGAQDWIQHNFGTDGSYNVTLTVSSTATNTSAMIFHLVNVTGAGITVIVSPGGGGSLGWAAVLIVLLIPGSIFVLVLIRRRR